MINKNKQQQKRSVGGKIARGATKLVKQAVTNRKLVEAVASGNVRGLAQMAGRSAQKQTQRVANKAVGAATGVRGIKVNNIPSVRAYQMDPSSFKTTVSREDQKIQEINVKFGPVDLKGRQYGEDTGGAQLPGDYSVYLFDLNPLYQYYNNIQQEAAVWSNFIFRRMDFTFAPSTASAATSGSVGLAFVGNPMEVMPSNWTAMQAANNSMINNINQLTTLSLGRKQLVGALGKTSYKTELDTTLQRAAGNAYPPDPGLKSLATDLIQGTLVLAFEGLAGVSIEAQLGTVCFDFEIEYTVKRSVPTSVIQQLSPSFQIDYTNPGSDPAIIPTYSQYWRRGSTNLNRLYYTGLPIRTDFDFTVRSLAAVTPVGGSISIHNADGSSKVAETVYDQWEGSAADTTGIAHIDAVFVFNRGDYISLEPITGGYKISMELTVLNSAVTTPFQ